MCIRDRWGSTPTSPDSSRFIQIHPDPSRSIQIHPTLALLKHPQNHQKQITPIEHTHRFFILLRSLDPSEPPLPPSELQNLDKSQQLNKQKTPQTPKSHMTNRKLSNQRNLNTLSNVSKPKQTKLPEGSVTEAQACKLMSTYTYRDLFI